MGRKKHQTEPNNTSNADNTSSESCDENQNPIDCSHVTKSISMGNVKRAVLKGFHTECDECRKSTRMETDADIIMDTSLWLCLQCGNQACGRYANKHALQHFKTPRSDSHALSVNTSTMQVWCYECQEDVKSYQKKALLEVVVYLKRLLEKNESAARKSPLSIHEIAPVEDKSEAMAATNSHVEPLSRATGLSNLGNTCFFNSVMQCLGQTPYLLQLLEETSQPGQYFILPGGRLDPDDQNSVHLDALDGTLEEWRPLTATLADTLHVLQAGRSTVFNPRPLFSRLTERMHQFAGGDQHDSHELLRHLLEAVREEDLRRYQVVILDKLGLSRRTNPQTVEGDKKKIVKYYGQQASELLLPTEQVFRGVLVSTLQCRECGHTSRRDEFFLDLSLPIPNRELMRRLPPPNNDRDDNSKPSKHQLKKEKKAARKNKKQKGNRLMLPSTIVSATKEHDADDGSESDADVEDNADDQMKQRNRKIAYNGGGKEEDIPKGAESGYNSEKGENGSPDSNARDDYAEMRIDDSGVPSPAIGMLCASPPPSVDHSPDSSETNIDMGSPLCGRNSPIDDNDDFNRPQSRLSFVNNKSDLKVDLEKLSIDKRYKLPVNEPSDDSEGEKMDEDDCDTNLWTDTISPRYECREGELSVQSCLNQFTACELLEGNNQVTCDLCTKRSGGKKAVYTNATKQLLVYNPPAVLILQLKRFQVLSFRSLKVSTAVSFPLILDLAPFCSKRSQHLSTFEAGQNKVLYSLYGVVEHSGGIHGGHYVAYVKVRAPLEPHSYRWQFLPKNQRQRAESGERSGVGGGGGEPAVPAGKWYYISDSHVSEVMESHVLTRQAYLLFYERLV